MCADSRPNLQDVLIDGHVHLHRCFDWTALLDSAVANFHRASAQLDLMGLPVRVLVLCDEYGFPAFTSLSNEEQKATVTAGWSIRSGAEREVLVASHLDNKDIFVIAGRQIRTNEDIEVLAICTREEFPDGRSFNETLDLVGRSDGVPVIPWGFGKWSGRRGRMVSELLTQRSRPKLLLGDNGGRLNGYPEPVLLKLARQVQTAVISGSDPLPFPNEEKRAGSYGTYAVAPFDATNACESVRGILTGPANELVTFGQLERPARFLRNQIRMQMKKRLGQKSAAVP